MRKLILLFIISFSAISCKEEKFEKPFLIIEVDSRINSEGYSYYLYQDNNGKRKYFYDRKDKYNVGDTIK